MSESCKIVGSLSQGAYEIFLKLANHSSEKVTAKWKIEIPSPARLSQSSNQEKDGMITLVPHEVNVVAGGWRLDTTGLAEHFLLQLSTLTVRASVTFQGFSDPWEESDTNTLDGLIRESKPGLS